MLALSENNRIRIFSACVQTRQMQNAAAARRWRQLVNSRTQMWGDAISCHNVWTGSRGSAPQGGHGRGTHTECGPRGPRGTCGKLHLNVSRTLHLTSN